MTSGSRLPLSSPAAVLLLALSGAPANADGPTPATPAVSGEVAVELQNDWNYRSDDRSRLNNSLDPKIEPSVTFRIAPRWSVFAHAVVEKIGEPAKFENRLFEDSGLFMEDLYVEYAGDRLGAKAGKLNPGFGVGWDRAAGVYGRDFAEEGYEISERIGVLAGWRLAEGRTGTHTVSGGSFFADTTILSESALRGRGDRRRQDGGVSNTESFDSFIVAVDGEGIPLIGDTGYHLSVMNQAAGAGATSDEKSIAAAIFTTIDLGRGVSFAPLVEGVRQDNLGGVETVDRTFLVLSGRLAWNGWNVALAHTERATRRRDAGDDRDSLSQVSMGYEFDFGLSVDIGWKIANEANIETRTLGALAAYTFKF